MSIQFVFECSCGAKTSEVERGRLTMDSVLLAYPHMRNLYDFDLVGHEYPKQPLDSEFVENTRHTKAFTYWKWIYDHVDSGFTSCSKVWVSGNDGEVVGAILTMEELFGEYVEDEV